MARVGLFLQQASIRLVYQSRVFVWFYKGLSFMAYGYRRGFRLRNAVSAFETLPPDSIPIDLRHHHRYRSSYADLPGWFVSEAQAVWDSLLAHQRTQGIAGDLLEIGVFKGKSAACTALHTQAGETNVFVDRMILPEFRSTMNSIPGRHLFLETPSEQLASHPEIQARRGGFRWIHIDGEHSGVAVKRDLATAFETLAPQGIICVDDFPSCAYPQVNFAVTEFLCQQPLLAMFLCGHNKGYICHRDALDHYLNFVKTGLHREMTRRGAEVTIWKSGRPEDWNCFGITNRAGKFDYRGPDWDTLSIRC